MTFAKHSGWLSVGHSLSVQCVVVSSFHPYYVMAACKVHIYGQNPKRETGSPSPRKFQKKAQKTVKKINFAPAHHTQNTAQRRDQRYSRAGRRQISISNSVEIRNRNFKSHLNRQMWNTLDATLEIYGAACNV